MSIEHFGWAWKQELPCVEKIVLLALADCRNLKDGRCDPSIKFLMAKCGLSERSVQRSLQALLEKGFIAVDKRRDDAGRQTSNAYSLLCHPAPSQGHPPPARETPPEGATVAPKPESSEPESEPYLVEASSTDTPAKQKNGKKASPYDQEFQAWYEGYPRKVGRGQALKAYRAARKKASLETLIAGRDRYAAGVRGKDRTFVKHPATWLNGECWADEPDDEAYREVCLNVARLRFVHGQRDYPWPADQHGPEPPFETLIGYLEPSDRDSVMAQKAAGLLR